MNQSPTQAPTQTPVQAPAPSLRLTLAVCLSAGLGFVLLAAFLVPWEWLPGGTVEAVPADSVFTRAQIERGENVSGMLRHTGWASLAVSLLVALWLGLTRTGSRLVARLPGPWAVQAFLAVGAVTAIGSLATLPFGWRAQRIELDNDLSRQSWGSWATDRLLDIGVVWAFTAIAFLVLMAVARKAPRSWPAWCAGLAATLAFLGSYVYPVIVEPLFNDFSSMPAGPLRSQIFDLAEQENVHIDDVLVADASRRTTRLNAYVSGIGNTKRVVVYDTLLEGVPDAEILSVVAHELGHTEHDDVLVGTCLAAVGSAFGVGLLGLVLRGRRFRARTGADGLGDPRVIPAVLMLAAVGTLLASPVENTISRAVEARADRTSLEATGDAATFIEMQRQLALRSLADPTPPRLSAFWFGSHPTVLQRVGMAREMAREMTQEMARESRPGR